MDFGPDIIKINGVQVNTTEIEQKTEVDSSLQEDLLAASIVDMKIKLEKIRRIGLFQF